MARGAFALAADSPFLAAQHEIEGGYSIEAVAPEGFAEFVLHLSRHGYPRRQRHHPAQGARAGAGEAGCSRPRGRRCQHALVRRRDPARHQHRRRRLHQISMPPRPAGTAPTDAVVLGAGGSARAVVFGLLERGIGRIHLPNRSTERAQALANQFGAKSFRSAGTRLDAALPHAGLLVNTTSLGMARPAAADVDLAPLPRARRRRRPRLRPAGHAAARGRRPRGLRPPTAWGCCCIRPCAVSSCGSGTGPT